MTLLSRRGMLPRMQARVWPALCLMVGALPCVACNSGTETGNPSFGGALSYTGYSSKPDDYGVREGGALATVESVWLDLDTVRVSPEGPCGIDEGDAFTAPALGVGDHAAGAHNFTPFATTAGAFCSFDLPFLRIPASAKQAGLPVDARGQSVLFVGRLRDGTPFSIASTATPVVQLHGEGSGFALSADQSDLLLAFDFAAWLEGLDFDAAERVDGRIVISASSNSQLLDAFEANLALGVALYRDGDGDGQLDPEAEPLAHAR